MPAKYVRVRQVPDAPTTSRKLIEPKKKDPEQYLREVRRYSWKRWMETGKGETLVVCQEKVEDWLVGKLPEGVISVEHFNNVSGRDRISGRALDHPDSAHRALAARDRSGGGGAIGAQPVLVPEAPQFAWYPSVPRGIRMRDGSGRVVDKCDQHPDAAFGERGVRWLVCEGELIQAIGQAHGVNRDAIALSISIS